MMKKLLLFLIVLSSFAVGCIAPKTLTADDPPATTVATATTVSTTTAQYCYECETRVNLWRGEIVIEYGKSFDFAPFFFTDSFYNAKIEVWGEEETTLDTDFFGEFDGMFNTCVFVNVSVSPGHFIVTNWNPEPLSINEINLFLD